MKILETKHQGRRSKRRPSLLLAIIAIILAMRVLAGCADRIILFPSRHPVDPGGASRHAIDWRDGQLEMWIARSPGAGRAEPEAYALELCGNATRAEMIADWVAHRWGSHPVEVWALNYPGYGGSSGNATLSKLGPSALAAYDALAERANGKPIFVTGHSIGTAAALHVAANRKVAGVIAHNPPPLRKLILGNYGWWNLWLGACAVSSQVPEDLDSLTNARASKAPAIFILADADTVVPPKYQHLVFDAYAGEKRKIDLPGGAHNDPPEELAPKELKDSIEWLWEKRP